MYYFFPGTHIEELEAEKLMGGSLGVEHTHDMLVLFVNLIVGLENHPPVQRDSSLPVLYYFCNISEPAEQCAGPRQAGVEHLLLAAPARPPDGLEVR